MGSNQDVYGNIFDEQLYFIKVFKLQPLSLEPLDAYQYYGRKWLWPRFGFVNDLILNLLVNHGFHILG
jgi:hypothetical protein